MDDTLRDRIRQLAEENDLDPEQLETLFDGAPMSDALEKTVENVLGDVELFEQALNKLKSPKQ